MKAAWIQPSNFRTVDVRFATRSTDRYKLTANVNPPLNLLFEFEPFWAILYPLRRKEVGINPIALVTLAWGMYTTSLYSILVRQRRKKKINGVTALQKRQCESTHSTHLLKIGARSVHAWNRVGRKTETTRRMVIISCTDSSPTNVTSLLRGFAEPNSLA